MEDLDISKSQSTSLSELASDKYTNSCSDYVKYRKMQKRCESILKDVRFHPVLKIDTFEKQTKLIFRTDDIFNRSNSIAILDFWRAYHKLNDLDFILFVLKPKPKRKSKNLK